MGWWWSSSASPEKASTTPKAAVPADPQIATPIPSPKALSREEQADKELEDFLASLEGPSTPSTYTRHSTTSKNEVTPAPQETPLHYAPSGTTDPTSDVNPDPHHVNLDTLDITPNALYPRTMSCRQAFDQAFYCQSMGGKFNDLYRYGSIQSCSQHWGAFWFCMRVKNLGDTERERSIAEWYENREERLKKERGGSSEDVWEIRTEPVKKAFWKNPDEITDVGNGSEEKV
ncbi:hypothetical protein BDV97DRAFT_346348 [Delphinella strobiligena]|nr:hypothetical protein BDV97DRAFT_346348 [Delphinella strobiligena]